MDIVWIYIAINNCFQCVSNLVHYKVVYQNLKINNKSNVACWYRTRLPLKKSGFDSREMQNFCIWKIAMNDTNMN